MNISPRRRRRMQREHQLRQNGRTLEYIAEKLDVSVATVHADLRLLETNWADFALATRNDLLLQQINRVNRRIRRLINNGAVGINLCTTIDEVLRSRALHSQELNAACRELRLLLRELPADSALKGEIIDVELADYPDYELADSEETRKNLKEPESLQPAIPHKTGPIATSPAPKKNSPENLKPAPPPAPTGPLPKNTGRNKPCPCGSGRKRKLCHPQHAQLVPPAPAPERGLVPGHAVPADIEAEVVHLTQQFEAAQQANDQLAQVRALEKLATLPGK